MKHVLITGASSGIGESCAKLFSENGWKVFLLGRSQEKLTRVQKELKNPSEILAFDLGKKESFKALEKRLSELKSDISVLVNNAGIYQRASLEESDDSVWSSQFEVNLFGPVRLTQLLWSQLKKNKGAVTNVSSTLGLRPIPATGAYSASKAALNSWSQTLALEGAPDVRVNTICPGLVDTPIHTFDANIKAQLQNLQPLARMGQPEDIASAVLFVSTAAWMTGTLVPVDGGVSLTTRDS